MTPVQYWVYKEMGIPSDIAIRMAFATGLFVMLPVCAASAWGHSRRQAVWWKPALALGGFGLLGAFGGATLASHISATPLKIIFGVTVLAVAVGMVTANVHVANREPKVNFWLWGIWALPLSFMAGLTGVGGGVFMVPLMVLVLGFRMHVAVGTSVAAISMISVGGIAGYIVNGVSVAGIPSPSIGYVYIWPWLCLAATGFVMAQVGVRIAHSLPSKQLAWIFSILALYIGLRMIGVFEWVGWPP